MPYNDFAWFYVLFFLFIPLMRILPRLVRRIKKGNGDSDRDWMGRSSSSPSSYRYFEESSPSQNDHSQDYDNAQPHQVGKANPDNPPQKTPASSKPQTKDMQVLGELNRGITKFEGIQRNTNIGRDELNSILEDLENRGLMKVKHKKGLLGTQVELHPTQEGFWKYHS